MQADKFLIAECAKLKEASKLFSACIQDYSRNYVQEINEKIKAGKASLHSIENEGREIGYFAIEIDNGEFWVLALAVENSEKIYDSIERYLCEMAKKAECKRISFCTLRPGLIRKTIASGYQVSQIILTKSL